MSEKTITLTREEFHKVSDDTINKVAKKLSNGNSSHEAIHILTGIVFMVELARDLFGEEEAQEVE